VRYLIYVPQAGLFGKENIFVQESLSYTKILNTSKFTNRQCEHSTHIHMDGAGECRAEELRWQTFVIPVREAA